MKKTSIISAMIYLGISAIAALAVFVGTFSGNFTRVERIGAAIWVFILANIILMPVIIPLVKKRINKEVEK